MTYCLDTSIVVDLFRGNTFVSKKLDKIRALYDVYISYITVCELFKGAFLHLKAKEKIEQVNDFLSYFEIIDFDIPSCKEFGRLFKKLKDSGTLIPEFDLLIVALAKANNLILITKDKKHFKDAGIKLEEW